MKKDVSFAGLVLAGGLLLGACGGGKGGPAAPPLARLFINELEPSNQDTVTDEYGEPDDWIEIYNDSDAAIEMQGYSFADSSGLSQSVMGSVWVQPRAFKLFWADDSPGQGANHLGFKLSATAGDSVTLKDPSGRNVDHVSFGPATGQNSYARFPMAWASLPGVPRRPLAPATARPARRRHPEPAAAAAPAETWAPAAHPATAARAVPRFQPAWMAA